MMDFSIFDEKDFSIQMQIHQLRAQRINKDDNFVLCRGYLGAHDSRQAVHVKSAMGRAVTHFAQLGIQLEHELHDNDTIKNIYKWGPTETIDDILKGDFHLWTAHFHEGNIAKRVSWNMTNMLSNMNRLEFHLGNIMGKKNRCPILRQGKIEIYDIMSDFCLPTIAIKMPPIVWTGKLDNDELFKLRE